ncbi:MAG: ABC transporter ATP-binding protein [Pseudonocardiaceae bacterium]
MIEVRELIKDYGGKRALNQLSFTARPGVVTGVVGPHGSGKSTTLRIILGLDTPTSGTALVNGKPHATNNRPMHAVGALLEAPVLPGERGLPGERSAAEHLQYLACSNGIGRHRVAEVLDEVGLSPMAQLPIDRFSRSMRQRLGIAGALLGDPGVLLFDEPTRDLDPEGIQWIRDLMQSLADEGRTVLASSNRMSEMALSADQLLIIRNGKLIMETSALSLTERFQRDVFVRSPRRSALTRVLTSNGATVRSEPGGGLAVTGMDAWRIASVAAEHHIPIQELSPRNTSLEDFYLELTKPTKSNVE